MSKNADIPQHELRNSKGEVVNFDLIQWGTVQNYNYERPHRHHFHEILVFENGGGRHDIDFDTYTAHAGSVHFVGCDSVHMLLRDKESAGYSLLFTADYLPTLLIEQLPFSKTKPVLQLDTDVFDKVRQITNQIKAELESNEPHKARMIQLLMESLLLCLLRIYSDENNREEQAVLPSHISQFRQLIKQRYKEHLSVEGYASLLNISAKHLIDICKKHTGKTPLKQIQDHMASEAKKLLYHTPLSVKEVAYELNFDEPANFSKYFKAATGYTPAEYRKGIR